MNFELSIHFTTSQVNDQDDIFDYASHFDRFTPSSTETEQHIIKTSNHEILAKYPSFLKLMEVLAEQNSARIQYKQSETDPISFLKNIKEIAACFLEYEKAEDKSVYCDNREPDCWGCRYLKGIIHRHQEVSYVSNNKYWYQFGSYRDSFTWGVDKEELYKVLTKSVDTEFIDFCPIFQYSFFRKILASLPATIDVNDSEHWGQVYLDEVVTEQKRWLPVNVQHKSSATNALAIKKNQVKKSRLKDLAGKDSDKGDLSQNQYLRNIPDTSFDDIGGIEDILQSIREVIELPIKQPELYEHMGITPYRGILLWGEPGNGKTLIAKAIAHEVKAHFIPIAGPDVLNKSFGESEKNLRNIFEEAKRLQPTIIFIDEIDAIAQARLAGETSKWYATVVNQLLALMDGIVNYGNVTVMASTNRPDLLDPALMRPGRFDYKLEIKKPNLHGCKKILDIVTKDMPLSDDVDLFHFAEVIIGYSAAEIAFLAREAAMVAVRRKVDINSIILNDMPLTDIKDLTVKRSDFYTALVTLKKNARYNHITYSLKG